MVHTTYSILNGGLCNQLFEIAAAYAYCRRHGYTLQISETTGGGRPTYWKTFLHNCVKYVRHPPYFFDRSKLWREPHFHFAPIPSGMTALTGYYQSSKYFNDYATEILTLFDPAPCIKQSVTEKYGTLLSTSDKINTVVIHMRRTDYINNETHGILGLDYYTRAIEEIKQHISGPNFLVFSDDLEWCRQQACFADYTFVDEPDDCVALHLMSQFRHYIMANSTFSWWASWLGEPSEVVIVPDRWFGPSGHQDWQDIYEPHWLRIPAH